MVGSSILSLGEEIQQASERRDFAPLVTAVCPAVSTSKKPQTNTGISWGVLGYFFDACRTGCMTAFASDLHITRSGIAARLATVFLASFHRTSAGNVGADVLLRCGHKPLTPISGNEKNTPHYSAHEL
jgi:hypothetical protein